MSILQDVKYAVRSLRRTPGFTIAALLSLALGVGANTAIFTIVDAVLLRILPVQKPNQLVLFGAGQWAGIWAGVPAKDPPQLFSFPFFEELRFHDDTFAEVTAMHSIPARVHLHNPGQTLAASETVTARMVAGNYFHTLGVPAAKGRMFSDRDDGAPGEHPLAVISSAFWRTHFGSDPDIAGRPMVLNNTVFTIIGVAPAEFFGTTVGEAPAVWVPLAMQQQISPRFPSLANPRLQSLHLIARLRPAAPVTMVQARVSALYRHFWIQLLGPAASEQDRRSVAQTHIELVSAARGLSQLRDQFSTALRLLMIVVGIVLLIACANLANLMLARSAAQRRELSLRLALGAGQRQMLSHVLCEALLLSAAGGALGALFGSSGSRVLLHFIDNTESLPTGANAHVFLFTLAVSAITGLLFGFGPAVRASRLDPGEMLKEGGRSLSQGRSHATLSRSLVAVQIAFSVVLIAGAALFVRSLGNLRSIDTGFSRQHVGVFELDTESSGYKQDSRLLAALERVQDRVDRIPGVAAASASLFVFNQGTFLMPFWKPGMPTTPENAKPGNVNAVTDGYFNTLGLKLLEGRTFGVQDAANSLKVAILSKAAAKLLFGNEPTIGKTILSPGDTPQSAPIALQVVGVVADAKYNDVREEVKPMIYFPLAQSIVYPNNLVVRTTGNWPGIVQAVRQAVREADPNIPVGKETTLAEAVDTSLSKERLVSMLSSSFSVLALILAAVGLYGMLSYGVQRRIGEIGIRMALGANGLSILWLVGREALMLLGIGFVVGIPAAAAGAHAVRSLLFGLQPADPAAIATAALTLCATAGAAAIIPVVRAIRVDPVGVFRQY